MTTALNDTPDGQEIRSMVEQRLEQALKDGGAKVTVYWRGEQRHLDVITMPVHTLYFNPETHRIRAQRSVDPEKDRTLGDAPWSPEGQEYLHQLLRWKPSSPGQEDPDYKNLMNELDESSQREPGIITPSGVLVDGNTRCAALRDLGEQNIRVAVLPADASSQDVMEVELSLQLRKDRRREYSYINQLIAIEEQVVNLKRKEEDVARDFNMRVQTLQKDRWVYQLLQAAIDRSVTPDGATLQLIDFEGQQEKLRELHRDYVKLAASNPQAADQLLESRLAMVVLNYAKTTLRLADQDFQEKYLSERLPEELRSKSAAQSTGIPGLEDVVIPTGSNSFAQAKAVTDRLLRAKAAAKIGSDLSPQQVADAGKLIADAREAFDKATRLAGRNAELKQRQVAVPERISDAADFIVQCTGEFAEARAKRTLDGDAFDDALLTLRDGLIRLARQASSAFEEHGDGVAWLLQAAAEKD